jgi:hypothetical protein
MDGAFLFASEQPLTLARSLDWLTFPCSHHPPCGPMLALGRRLLFPQWLRTRFQEQAACPIAIDYSTLDYAPCNENSLAHIFVFDFRKSKNRPPTSEQCCSPYTASGNQDVRCCIPSTNLTADPNAERSLTNLCQPQPNNMSNNTHVISDG